MIFDYENLRLIWWLLLGVLLIGFAVMDGFDLGVAALLPFVARSDVERRIAINTIGPVWEGNQVWLVLGGGAIFAAWPPLYAVSFSGFYLAMFLVLASLILRPVGFTFRSKIDNPAWRSLWDWALAIGGVVPALIFGVAIGNALQGVPFAFDPDLRASYDISLASLLNPFGLLCGLASLAMLVMHGAAYLALKAGEPVASRARRAGSVAAIATIGLFALAGLATAFLIRGYAITSTIDPAGPSNPLGKTVARQTGSWLSNYGTHPWMTTAPALGFAGALLALLLFIAARPIATWLASSVSVAGIVATAGVSMFPFLLPSSSSPSSSLTVWDASSSRLTLGVMLAAAVVFIPIVLAYTAWVFRVMRGRVTAEEIAHDPHGVY
ncbi:MAG: cytochrome d ubiquinol oxidase subunit II [Roseiarcus sp.]|jgi:cytochrome d ubiquinol oxidase subunit II